MNGATETRKPSTPCPWTGAPRVEISTTSLIYVVYTSGKGFVPRVELGDVSEESAKTSARFARDELKAPGVRLAREPKTTTRIEYVNEDDAARADEERERMDGQHDCDNLN